MDQITAGIIGACIGYCIPLLIRKYWNYKNRYNLHCAIIPELADGDLLILKSYMWDRKTHGWAFLMTRSINSTDSVDSCKPITGIIGTKFIIHPKWKYDNDIAKTLITRCHDGINLFKSPPKELTRIHNMMHEI